MEKIEVGQIFKKDGEYPIIITKVVRDEKGTMKGAFNAGVLIPAQSEQQLLGWLKRNGWVLSDVVS